MAGVFFGITTRFYYFSYVIGRAEFSGPGFRNAVDMALGADDVIYVLNRSSEHRPDGVRVSVCNFAEEYITEFGSFGQGDGQFTWPTGIAVDSEDNVYVTDEWLNRISVFRKDGEFTGKWGKPGSWRRGSELASGNGYQQRRDYVPGGQPEPPDTEVHRGRAIPGPVRQLRQRSRPVEPALGHYPGQGWPGVCGRLAQ